MLHIMPQLPYDMEAFAGILSRESFEYHYGKHLQAYVDNLNRLIQGTEFENSTLEDIIVRSEGGIYNNAAQTWNHTLFFETLTPVRKEIPEKLLSLIERDFGSAEKFKEEMLAKAAGQFGSGWAWLSKDKDGRLAITAESNAGNPMRSGLKPILTLDVWEHAYYIDYRNKRADYLKAIWEHIDWEKVSGRI